MPAIRNKSLASQQRLKRNVSLNLTVRVTLDRDTIDQALCPPPAGLVKPNWRPFADDPPSPPPPSVPGALPLPLPPCATTATLTLAKTPTLAAATSTATSCSPLVDIQDRLNRSADVMAKTFQYLSLKRQDKMPHLAEIVRT